MPERAINWGLRVRRGEVEVEAIGTSAELTKKYFDELATKYLK